MIKMRKGVHVGISSNGTSFWLPNQEKSHFQASEVLRCPSANASHNWIILTQSEEWDRVENLGNICWWKLLFLSMISRFRNSVPLVFSPQNLDWQILIVWMMRVRRRMDVSNWRGNKLKTENCGPAMRPQIEETIIILVMEKIHALNYNNCSCCSS